MTRIPPQLQKDSFRFIKVKANSKTPIETGWTTTKNYTHNDPTLTKHLKAGGNYGILGGLGNLLILDFDNEAYEQSKIPHLPKTFTTKSGSGRLHLYYYCTNTKSWKITDDKKNTLVDILGTGKQAIGPNSTHPNKNKYTIHNNTEIATIKIDLLHYLFADQHPPPKNKNKAPRRAQNLAEKLRDTIQLRTLLEHYNYNLTQNPTMCQLGHDSKSKKCFSYNTAEHLWYCFNCGKGGDIITLVMEHENITFLTALKKITEITGIKPDTTLTIDNYAENAERFQQEQPFFYDTSGAFWLWNHNTSVWEMKDDTDMLRAIDTALSFGGQVITSRIRQNYLNAFKHVGRGHVPNPFPTHWVQFKHNIFDIKTKKIKPSTPRYYSCNAIPWDFGTTPDTPEMNKLFTEWVGEKYKETLYEIIAYCCIPDYPIHNLFALIGIGSNGKSKFQALLTKFIGIENLCSTELDTLIDSRFESSKLYKKLVCLMGETEFGILKKTSLLKKLTGQDFISFEFKQKKPFDDMNYAKIIIASNGLPSSDDMSDGFYRRWLIIDFPNQFSGKEEVLDRIPEEEYRNLALKVTKILPSLLERRKFTNQSRIIEQQKKRFIESSNPLPSFIAQKCVTGTTMYIRFGELYNAYIDHLRINRKRRVTQKEFLIGLENEGYFKIRTTKRPWGTPETEKKENAHWVEYIQLIANVEKQTEIGEFTTARFIQSCFQAVLPERTVSERDLLLIIRTKTKRDSSFASRVLERHKERGHVMQVGKKYAISC